MISEEDARAGFIRLLDREPRPEDRIGVLAERVDSVSALMDLLSQTNDASLSSTVTLGRYRVPLSWPVKGEPRVTFREKLTGGFFAAYLSGETILDVGFRGGRPDAVPILPQAIGVDLGYPGYDGRTLPFPDGSVDTVYSSHTLEHIEDSEAAIRDWYRVLAVGGFMVCVVPHQFLYEKRRALPSRFNPDHKRFYTPASLVAAFEAALEPNCYRVRHLRDNDVGYSYDIGPERHANVEGSYEIEIVIEKIQSPGWTLA